jgi:hypothetical protein
MEVCSSTEIGCPRCLAFGNGRPRTQNRPKQTTISPGKRPCVQQTITVYRLARNGLGGDQAGLIQFVFVAGSVIRDQVALARVA